MVKLIGHLSLLKPQKILVIGDLMLDTYTMGKASRISPEAPVPVLHVCEERSLPGGAGNVALNLLSLGQEVRVVGRHGQDLAGEELRRFLDNRGLFVEKGYPTPIKNRVIANNQQMIRIDHETILPLSLELEKEILKKLPELLSQVKMVAISDYGKGLLTRNLLRGLIDQAREQKIPVIADPKGADFSKYRGVTLLKPNLKEAYKAAHMPPEATLDEVAAKLFTMTETEKLIITRSEEGISLFEPHGRRDFPVKAKEVKDVTGAGDTVLATLAAALASSLSLDQAIELSNVAASLAVEHVGCARITLSEMASRLLEEHAFHKLIDAAHAPALHYALQNRPHTIIKLSSDSDLDPLLYQKIQSLKATPSHTLVMSLPLSVKNPHLIPMLTSLREVDFVIQSEE